MCRFSIPKFIESSSAIKQICFFNSFVALLRLISVVVELVFGLSLIIKWICSSSCNFFDNEATFLSSCSHSSKLFTIAEPCLMNLFQNFIKSGLFDVELFVGVVAFEFVLLSILPTVVVFVVLLSSPPPLLTCCVSNKRKSKCLLIYLDLLGVLVS